MFSPEGERIEKDIYDDELKMPVADLLECLEDHEALKKLILCHVDKTAGLELNQDQVNYGEIFLSKRLIDPEWDT